MAGEVRKIVLIKDGPLELIGEDGQVSICRCGKSKARDLCDNSCGSLGNCVEITIDLCYVQMVVS